MTILTSMSGRDTEVSIPTWATSSPQDTEIDDTSNMGYEAYREWVLLSAHPGSPIDKSP